ncbi:MAG: ATP-dependent DNA helicase, partial [Kiloniellales bacterium]
MVAGWRRATWLSAEGEIEALAPEEVAARAAESPPLVCHAPASARRLGIAAFPALDLLELFAFVRPGQFVAPTPRALAVALSLEPPADAEAGCASLIRCAAALLSELVHDAAPERAAALASEMARGGWRWGPAVLQALGAKTASAASERKAVAVWDRLPNWRDQIEHNDQSAIAV